MPWDRHRSTRHVLMSLGVAALLRTAEAKAIAQTAPPEALPAPGVQAGDLCERPIVGWDGAESVLRKYVDGKENQWQAFTNQEFPRRLNELLNKDAAIKLVRLVEQAESMAGMPPEPDRDLSACFKLTALDTCLCAGDASTAYLLSEAIAEQVYERAIKLLQRGWTSEHEATALESEAPEIRSARVLFFMLRQMAFDVQRLGAGPFDVNPIEEQRLVRDIDARFGVLRSNLDSLNGEDWRRAAEVLSLKIEHLEKDVREVKNAVPGKQGSCHRTSEAACIGHGDDKVALITVKVPQDARVWFGGTRTMATGSVRYFESPRLMRGDVYTYQICAQWSENGRKITQIERITVTAGGKATCRFPIVSEEPPMPSKVDGP